MLSTQNAHATIRTFVLGACAFLLFTCALPSHARAEYINAFESSISIKQDSTFDVAERIEYIFSEEKQGVYRCIPLHHEEAASSFLKIRHIDIDVRSAKMDASDVPYTVDESGEEVCITIGDPAGTVSGKHVYEIEYRVAGAVSYLEFGGADLYWDVVGDAWNVPIRSVVAQVSSPDSILLRERSCSYGKIGDTFSCTMRDDAGVVYFSAGNLNPHEGLTFSQALDRGKIAYDVRERYNLLILGIFLSILVLSAGAYLVYRHRTKYKTDDAIIPQYEPYENIKPMDMGVLFDGKLDPKDIAAGIVYLAEKGCISIKKIDTKVLYFFEVDDFSVTLHKVPDGEDIGFEIELLHVLFGDVLTSGTQVVLSNVRGDTARTQKNAKQIGKLQDALMDSLLARGFYTSADFMAFITQPVVAVLAILGIVIVVAFTLPVYMYVVALCVAFVALSGPRRSKLGYEAQDYLKGFKDFLRVTEAQRYIFHNAPEKNAEHFMEFLPYAIAFGVEKEWAKTFEGITIPQPAWYDGGASGQYFSAVPFADSLSGFTQSLAGTMSTQSTSSSGSVTGSGSGGGGGGSW